ncbi:MAG: amino acid permease [Actinomyces sp.]|nr:amino acid permease [Actinomyces sp.]MCI1788320.1 amino acid permease [Actinomyces sp.]
MVTLAIIMSLVPWQTITGDASPFAQIFTALGVPAASILNMVVIVAAMPAINADTSGAGRMLFGLAEGGHAPAAFAKVSKRGVPWAASAVMCGALGVGAILNAAVPEGVFVVVASLATFVTVRVWRMVL